MAGTNWAGNIAFSAHDYQRPVSVPELQALVARSGRVRAVGTGHSFNPIADTDGIQVTTAGLPQQVELDTGTRTARVSAGMTYAEIAPALEDAGLALRNLGSLPHISIAGACATGTHGSGDGNANLATSVSAIEVVVASGEVVTLSRGQDPDRFPGSVVALGRLGIVTHLTLDLVPTYAIAQHVFTDLPDRSLRANIDEIFRGGYSVSVFLDGSDNRIWCKRLASDPVPDHRWMGATAAREPLNPVRGLEPERCTEQLGVPGPWHRRLPHFRPEFTPSTGAELQSEYLLPRVHAADALASLHDLRARIVAVLQVAELRTVAADDLWLSPSYGRDTIAFHFTWAPDPRAVAEVVRGIEARLAPFAPRPHWGKVFELAPSAVCAEYERLPDFCALVRDFDPTGKFGNVMVDRFLR